MRLPLSSLAVLTSVSIIEAANILAILPVLSVSHTAWIRPLLDALEAKGHNITVLSPFKHPNPGPNHTDILLENVYASWLQKNKRRLFIQDKWYKVLLTSIHIFGGAEELRDNEMSTNGVRQLLSYPPDSFDLIMIDHIRVDSFYGFAHKFGYPPIIGLVPFSTIGGELAGNPVNPAYIPHLFFPGSEKMNFWERVLNTVLNVGTYLCTELYSTPARNQLSRDVFGSSARHINDISKNMSLVFLNSVQGFDYPRPMMPQIIPVGGLGKTQPNLLPEEFQTFLDNAPDGVIIFSLGSRIRTTDLRPDLIDSMMSAFKQLPQRVLWKWDGEDLPQHQMAPNVWLVPWMPQKDIFTHPNIKLFITHGGMNGILESAGNGVPIIVLPVDLEQHHNAALVVYRGVGVQLNLALLTADVLLNAIYTVISNSSYKEAAKTLAANMEYSMTSALDRAIYWTEVVLRTKGARHLRSQAADLPFYQLYMLDILAAMLALLAGYFMITIFIIRKLFLLKKNIKTKMN